MKKLNIFLLLISLFFFSCGEDDGGSLSSGEVPAVLLGNMYNLEFATANYGPYKMGDIVEFTFSSSGSLFIKDANSSTLQLDEFGIEGSEVIWEDNDHSKRYALSLKNDNSEINEINLLEQSDNSFLGQFVPAGEGADPLDIIKGLATKGKNGTGHYDVVSVSTGTHERMTILIDPDGNMNFDETISFEVTNYAQLTDETECCDGIYIDMAPYPTESYPRLEVYLDDDGNLSEMHYSPEYPNVTGKVEITF
jgi:hypothetical protein